MSTMKCNPCCDNLKGRKAEFLILTIWLLHFRCIHLIAQHFHIPSRWFLPAGDLKQHHKFSLQWKLDSRNYNSPSPGTHLSHCETINHQKALPKAPAAPAGPGLSFPFLPILPALGRHILYPSRISCQRHWSQGGFLHTLKSGTRRACLLAQLSAVTKNAHMFAHDIRNPTSPWNSAFKQHLCLQTAWLSRRFLNIHVFCTTPTLPLLAGLRSGASLHILLSYFYSYFVHSPSWSLYQARLWLQLILFHLF